jgi:hypothetical protein
MRFKMLLLAGQSAIVAVVMLLTACNSLAPVGSPKASPTIAVDPTALNRPAAPSPTVAIANAYEKGLVKAASAKNQTAVSQNKGDWELVIAQWQAAIELMQAVPRTNPNYADAQKHLAEYRRELAKTKQLAKRGGSLQDAAATNKKSSVEGTPLIAGGNSSGGKAATPNPAVQKASREAVSTISQLNQQQNEFLLKNKRFAASWQELKSSLPAETENYTYNTGELSPNRVVSMAIARKGGLLSYTGVVFATKFKNKDVVLAGICVTKQPSTTPPTPQFTDTNFTCPANALRL